MYIYIIHCMMHMYICICLQNVCMYVCLVVPRRQRRIYGGAVGNSFRAAEAEVFDRKRKFRSEISDAGVPSN